MNPHLELLHPYPFERLRLLFSGAQPPSSLDHINMGIGEPQHPTPQLIFDGLTENFDGLAKYPVSLGLPLLRETIAKWLVKRYGLKGIDPTTEILPVTGSREALFALAQAVLDPGDRGKYVMLPNPFYQIYEGAAIMAGAVPYYLNCLMANDYRVDYASIPTSVWAETKMVYVCSPGNPTGAIMTLDDWRILFEFADEYGFMIASDECYSEIYFGEKSPLGGLEAATALGRDFTQLITFSSLSKRSNAPGLRSGFVAGDAKILKKFLLYRTYHGVAMSNMVQMASVAAWNDEEHVVENRAKYLEKFTKLTPMLAEALPAEIPEAAFFLWVPVPIDDELFARRLFESQNVTVLPGSYLAREFSGVNPGKGFIRLALVAEYPECEEAIRRIVAFIKDL